MWGGVFHIGIGCDGVTEMISFLFINYPIKPFHTLEWWDPSTCGLWLDRGWVPITCAHEKSPPLQTRPITISSSLLVIFHLSLAPCDIHPPTNNFTNHRRRSIQQKSQHQKEVTAKRSHNKARHCYDQVLEKQEVGEDKPVRNPLKRSFVILTKRLWSQPKWPVDDESIDCDLPGASGIFSRRGVYGT